MMAIIVCWRNISITADDEKRIKKFIEKAGLTPDSLEKVSNHTAV